MTQTIYDTPDNCNHEWQWISEYIGDPNVINGTMDTSSWECVHCGARVRELLDTDREYKTP